MASNSLRWRIIHTNGSGSTKEFDYTDTQTAGAETIIGESIADATTDGLVAFTSDISQLQMIIFWSTVAMTLETNSGSTPQETFTLTANQPVTWQTGETAIFAGDVTALYLTNASGGAGTFNLIALEDPTV